MSRKKSNYGADVSRYKLKIWFKNNPGNSNTFFSYRSEEKNGNEACLRGMVARLIYKNEGKYTTAVIYDQQTDKPVVKYVNGIRTI